MTEEDFLALTFENIQEHADIEDIVRIRFEINGFPYVLSVFKNTEGIFKPAYLSHGTENDYCPLCQRDRKTLGGSCAALRLYKKRIFELLTTSNHLRLHWLFRAIQ